VGDLDSIGKLQGCFSHLVMCDYFEGASVRIVTNNVGNGYKLRC
jgi:hypothetical protein